MQNVSEIKEIIARYYCYKAVLKKKNGSEYYLVERLHWIFRVLMFIVGILALVLAWYIYTSPGAFHNPPPPWAIYVALCIGVLMIVFSLITNRYVKITFSSTTKDLHILKNSILFTKESHHYMMSDVTDICMVTYVNVNRNNDGQHKRHRMYAIDIHLKDGMKIRCSEYRNQAQTESDLNIISKTINKAPNEGIIDLN